MGWYKAVCVATVLGWTLFAPTPVASADYTNADIEFVADVASSLTGGVVDANDIDRIIADGHKVCDLMDAGQVDVIDPYIAYKYPEGPGSTYGLRIFAAEAAAAYCPRHSQMLSGSY